MSTNELDAYLAPAELTAEQALKADKIRRYRATGHAPWACCLSWLEATMAPEGDLVLSPAFTSAYRECETSEQLREAVVSAYDLGQLQAVFELFEARRAAELWKHYAPA